LLVFVTLTFLVIMILSTLFIDKNFLGIGDLNFLAWFSINLFSFICGWVLNKITNWKNSTRLCFVAILASLIIALGIVIYFKDFFNIQRALVENLVAIGFQIVFVGLMSLFGVTTSEVFRLQKELIEMLIRKESYEKLILDAKKEASLEIREAKLKAEQIIRDAEWRERIAREKKQQIEKQLREFIEIEKQLIAKYEKKEN